MNPFFITATGTDTGKTLLTAALTAQLRAKGRLALALKPVISGYAESSPHDAAILLQAMGRDEKDPVEIQKISPWRFVAPLSPDMAAARENRFLEIGELTQWCLSHSADPLLIEGAGGVMTPLNSNHTMLDWMQALQASVILVAGTYLGTLSHTLTACEAIRARGLRLHAVVLNDAAEGPVPPKELIENLAPRLPPETRLGFIPKLAAAERLWETVPDLSWMAL